jgi:hypothetical protein
MAIWQPKQAVPSNSGRPEDGRCQPMSMLAILVGLDPQKVAPFVRGWPSPRPARSQKAPS